MADSKQQAVDGAWLVKIFEEVGLEAEVARRAAEETRVRLLRRERPPGAGLLRRALTENLVRDPLVSLNRIIGRGDAGLPFFDEETGALSLVSFAHLLAEIGLDPVVAMAYAKVVVEAYEPAELYQPLWAALGRQGTVDLDQLRRLDWTPLRASLPAPAPRGAPPNQEVTATVATVVAVAKPAARPPGAAPRPSSTTPQPRRPQSVAPRPQPRPAPGTSPKTPKK